MLSSKASGNIRYAAQALHIEQVLGTTLALKTYLVEKDMPERTTALQLGTGFPVPESREGFEHIVFIPYGEGPLSIFSQPSVEGHSGGGIHIFRVTGGNGEQMTTLVLQGRAHGYAETDSFMPHLSLARMPTILKGIGIESIVTTFASGFDAIPLRQGQKPPKVGDFGVVFVNNGFAGEAHLEPGAGDQTLIGPVFGGPFLPTVNRKSDQRLAVLFKSVFDTQRQLYEDSPQLRPVILGDATSTPYFENAGDWADIRIRAKSIVEDGVLPVEVTSVFGSKALITDVHGMSTSPEISALHRSSVEVGGIDTAFNRSLRFLAVVGCTDLVDPRPEGQSTHVTHQEVQAAGERSAAFIAPVLVYYFRAVASN